MIRRPGFEACSREHHSRNILETLNPGMEQPAPQPCRILVALGRFWKMPLPVGIKVMCPGPGGMIRRVNCQTDYFPPPQVDPSVWMGGSTPVPGSSTTNGSASLQKRRQRSMGPSVKQNLHTPRAVRIGLPPSTSQAWGPRGNCSTLRTLNPPQPPSLQCPQKPQPDGSAWSSRGREAGLILVIVVTLCSSATSVAESSMVEQS